MSFTAKQKDEFREIVEALRELIRRVELAGDRWDE